MPFNFKIVNLFHQFLDFENSGVAKFYNHTTLFADHVIVLLVGIGAFVVILIFSKLLALYKAAFNKKIERVINSGTRYTCAGIFHVEKYIIGIKVAIRPVDFFKHHKPLGGLPLISLFEIRSENFFNQMNGFFGCLMCHVVDN